ncbi:MAG: ATP-binding cassette domain-containing protein [Phycisphaeraceae bacterium]
MIHVRELVKYYGPRLAVDHISLDVEQGQIVGILGPNGAGKSTTLRMLTCFLPPSSGAATVNGHNIFSDSEGVRRSIGYLPESTPLYLEMRVREQLHFFGRLHGLDRRTRKQRIEELTESCGLESIVTRPIGQLSRGNRQRVGIAQAMLHDPPVLILDEPTAGLDPTQINEVRKLIRQLGQRKTILLSTHILPEVEKTCDRVVIISQGKIAAEGTPEQLRSRVRAASRVLVEVKASADDVKRIFAQLSGVREVTIAHNNGWVQAAVTPENNDQDMREQLADAMLTQRWAVREMRPETGSLEEFFIQVTSS